MAYYAAGFGVVGLYVRPPHCAIGSLGDIQLQCAVHLADLSPKSRQRSPPEKSR
jgi:hypothetical protein